jgi:hypothetical protein
LKRVWGLVAILLAALLAAAWASDFLTFQGERTVYTADCISGEWKDDRCTGRVGAGYRYHYRAVKSNGEVLFWTVGSREPTDRLSNCAIIDGRNWTCPRNADAAKSVTLQMVNGTPRPTAGAGTVPCHRISKWRWFVLHILAGSRTHAISALPVGFHFESSLAHF